MSDSVTRKEEVKHIKRDHSHHLKLHKVAEVGCQILSILMRLKRNSNMFGYMSLIDVGLGMCQTLIKYAVRLGEAIYFSTLLLKKK